MTAITDTAARHRATLRATLIGATAILMWSTLAAFTTLVATVPPFQLVACSFALATAIGGAWTLARGGNPLAHLRQPVSAWMIGVGGLFGYHFLYFVALKLAPPVEANLINYLWPLLIVLFSALLPGERLHARHIAGAAAGLAGTVLLVSRGGGVSGAAEHLPGYLAALGCALTWSSYSVLRRRSGDVPTDAVSGFCLATAVLSLLCHLTMEETVWPADAAGWIGLIGLGAGPVGAAFFVWDIGVQRGDIRALGTLAYATPLLSTALLIVLGLATGGWAVWAACALIIAGSLVASQDLLRRGRGG